MSFAEQNKAKIFVPTLGLSIVGILAFYFYRRGSNGDCKEVDSPKPVGESLLTNDSVNVQEALPSEDKQSQSSEKVGHVETYDEKFLRVINQVRKVLD